MSHTIIKQLRDTSAKGSFLDFTTVWNYYNSGDWSSLLKRSNSNLHAMVKGFTKNDKKEGITIFTGAKGRSGHSATEVAVFRGNQTKDNMVGDYFSAEELIELCV